MGIAQKVYEWISIGPNATVGVWVQGYPYNEFVTYSITAKLNSNVPPSTVDVKAKMSIESTGPHVDGTVGRLVYVTNNSIGPQPYIRCELSNFRETLQS